MCLNVKKMLKCIQRVLLHSLSSVLFHTGLAPSESLSTFHKEFFFSGHKKRRTESRKHSYYGNRTSTAVRYSNYCQQFPVENGDTEAEQCFCVAHTCSGQYCYTSLLVLYLQLYGTSDDFFYFLTYFYYRVFKNLLDYWHITKSFQGHSFPRSSGNKM